MVSSLLFAIGIIVIVVAAAAGLSLSRGRLPRLPKAKAISKKDQKKQSKAQKELAKIKEQVTAIPGPDPVPLSPAPGTIETQGDIRILEEFPIDAKLGIEITRIVEGTHKRITIAKGRVSIKSGARPAKIAKLLFFVWQKGAQYFIDPRKIIKVTVPGKPEKTEFKLVFDILVGEPLNQDGTVTWGDDLELILADSTLDQYVTIAAFEGGFQFTPTLVRAMIVIGFLGLLIGIALDGAEHFIPTTEVHWIPVIRNALP